MRWQVYIPPSMSNGTMIAVLSLQSLLLIPLTRTTTFLHISSSSCLHSSGIRRCRGLFFFCMAGSDFHDPFIPTFLTLIISISLLLRGDNDRFFHVLHTTKEVSEMRVLVLSCVLIGDGGTFSLLIPMVDSHLPL